MDLNDKKIWIGGDNSLGEAVQRYAISKGWSWGKRFGEREIQKSVDFIQFYFYGGERRMFMGADGETSREAFEHLQKVEISPSDIGYAPVMTTSPIERGTKVKLLEKKGFPGESICMESLNIGEIYTVGSYREHYADNPFYEPTIQLIDGYYWLPLSAFSIVPTGTTPEYKPVICGVKINNSADLRVGMWVTFEKKIRPWNSSGGGKDPKDMPDASYPYTGKITAIPNIDGLIINDHWGFSRGESIRNGVIRIATADEVNKASGGRPWAKGSEIMDISGSMGTAIVTSTQTVKYDPNNIRVDKISKAQPKKTEFIKIEPLPVVNVPPVRKRITKEIPRITSIFQGVSI
jgi:hypothetical protein